MKPDRSRVHPPRARRVATPRRGGQTSFSRVRLTVSPENFPVTLYARACVDPTKPACVVPEKLPSGSSARFCIGTLPLASETTPDNRPRALSAERANHHSGGCRGLLVPERSKLPLRAGRWVP